MRHHRRDQFADTPYPEFHYYMRPRSKSPRPIREYTSSYDFILNCFTAYITIPMPGSYGLDELRHGFRFGLMLPPQNHKHPEPPLRECRHAHGDGHFERRDASPTPFGRTIPARRSHSLVAGS